MKKILNIGLLSVALIASIVANASNKINVTVTPSKQLSISLTEVSQGEILSVSDRNKEIVFSEVLDLADSFTKNLDFSTLKQGVYYVELKTEKTVKVTPFIVVPSKAIITKGKTVTYNTPKFTLENGVVTITLDNVSKNPVSIISYAEGKGIPLDKVTYANEAKIEKKYNLELMPYSVYNFYVSQGNYNYSETIKY